MPTDILVDKWEIKSTDIVHLNAFYIALHDYLWREEYSEAKDAPFPEIYYWESRKQKSKEMWAWWRPKKKVRSNSFFERFFTFDIHGVGIRDVEVMKGNKKWKVQMGKVEVLVKCILKLDPEGRWDKNPILKSFYKIFWKRIYKKNIDMHKKELRKDSYAMNENVKRIMELNTFSIPKKPFEPARAFGDVFSY